MQHWFKGFILRTQKRATTTALVDQCSYKYYPLHVVPKLWTWIRELTSSLSRGFEASSKMEADKINGRLPQRLGSDDCWVQRLKDGMRHYQKKAENKKTMSKSSHWCNPIKEITPCQTGRSSLSKHLSELQWIRQHKLDTPDNEEPNWMRRDKCIPSPLTSNAAATPRRANTERCCQTHGWVDELNKVKGLVEVVKLHLTWHLLTSREGLIRKSLAMKHFH